MFYLKEACLLYIRVCCVLQLIYLCIWFSCVELIVATLSFFAVGWVLCQIVWKDGPSGEPPSRLHKHCLSLLFWHTGSLATSPTVCIHTVTGASDCSSSHYHGTHTCSCMLRHTPGSWRTSYGIVNLRIYFAQDEFWRLVILSSLLKLILAAGSREQHQGKTMCLQPDIRVVWKN